MGLFDMFKKNGETEEKDNRPAVEENISFKAPDVKNNPTQKDRADNEYSDRKRVFIPWPKAGDELSKLTESDKLAVFVDASFVKSPQFSMFVQEWSAFSKIGKNVFYYIASFEKGRIPSLEESLSGNELCREIPCTNYSSCFESVKDEKYGIVLLTADSSFDTETQKAARENGLFLRWYGVNDEGKIEAFYRPDTNRSNAPSGKISKKPFCNETTFVKIAKNLNIPSSIPASGSQVISPESCETYTLAKPVMTDHSSITYTTNRPDMFAKIYTKKALQIDLFENKASRMIRENVNISGVCWPKAKLTNTSGQFVGILVPASKGVQLNRSILSGNSGIKQFFPTWNKKDVCRVAHTILDTICKLHRLGVRFGCLNPASIYVVDTNEVYFVDADNWQVEGFPTLSRNVTFTPPELLSENQKPHLFTIDEENYQIALLTFMIMMPGKYPYAKRRNNNELESIQDMSFPFSVGGDMRRSADSERPSGVWQIIWDHLPYRMCNSFYNSFHANGKFSKPGTRLRDFEWLNIVDEFLNNLMLDKNAESRELIPTTFRHDGKRTFARCKVCGKEHPDFYFLRSIRIQNEKINVWDRGYRVCLPCAVDQSDVSFTCKSCGRTFYYTNRTKLMHEIGKLNFDWNNQKWCHNCKKHSIKCSKCGVEVPVYQIKEFTDKRRNLTKSVCGNCFSELLSNEKQWKETIYQTLRCRQCGRVFNITNGEAEYFEQRGMNLPSRCPACRGRRF